MSDDLTKQEVYDWKRGYAIGDELILFPNQEKLNGIRRSFKKIGQVEPYFTPEVCPECNGTGKVTLFTSVQPCSLCGGRKSE